MRVLVAIDSFKGCLSSLEAGNAIKEGIKEFCDVVVKPVADGGEGSVEALNDALSAELIEVTTKDPLRKDIVAKYALSKGLAVLEMASSSGLTLLNKDERNPLNTDTFGFGIMIADAIKKGARKFIIGIGGSATNDAGMGMLNALGFEFLDKDDKILNPNGKNLINVAKISTKNSIKELEECEFLIACDVDNPLFGKNGAAHIYAPQKGADVDMVNFLDEGLKSFSGVVKNLFKKDHSMISGVGAAGGLGFAFVSFLNATLKPGIEIISDEIKLEDEIKNADLIITGEGKMDLQSSMGKTPTGIAKLAKRYNKPVVALAGSVSSTASECNKHGIDAFFSIQNEPIPLDIAMQKSVASENLKRVSEQVVRLFLLNFKGKN